MYPVPAAGPRRYHDLFDPRVPGFSPVFPLVLSAGLFVSYQASWLFAYFVRHISVLKYMFPSLQIAHAVMTMASAFLLLWLSRQLKNAWLIGLVYGACDGLIRVTALLISLLLKSPLISLWYWMPHADRRGAVTNLLWGVVLIGFLDVAIWLAGARFFPILAAGLAAWLVFGLCDRLVNLQAQAAWSDLAQWAIQGLIFGLAMYVALRGQRALRAAHAPPEAEGRERISKAFFFTAIVTGSMTVYHLLAGVSREPSILALASGLAGLAVAGFSGILSLVLVHRMWSAIQDGAARTSPGRAVGFLFIPIYNIYWLFQAYWGFAKDFNAYRERHSVPAAALPAGLFLAFCILSLFEWIPVVGFPIFVATLFVEMFMIAKICDAVNAIPA